MSSTSDQFAFGGELSKKKLNWKGKESAIAFEEDGIRSKLLQFESPCYVISDGKQLGVTTEGSIDTSGSAKTGGWKVVASTPEFPLDRLGDPEFNKQYGSQYTYYAGSMAHGISSEELVIALGQAGYMGSYGAGGITPDRLEEAILKIQGELLNQPYAFNLIKPFSDELERRAVELYLKHGVTTIEASAYIDLSPHIVHYRVAGLSLNANGQIEIKNRIIAKSSRREVFTKFLEPAPDKYLQPLIEQGLITEEQAKLAQQVPMADDLTVEADSGGHTDNRPLVSLLPSIIALRNEIQDKFNYPTPIRVGAAGGIGTPEAALAAYVMGAAYVVTGSVNQACLESATSDHVRKLLAQAEMPDVIMAPAVDMFATGGELQVIKRGTFFPMRAKKLYDLYRTYKSLDEIPQTEVEKLEKQIFQTSLADVWQKTEQYWNDREPEQLTKAAKNPKKKMELAFCWYLGLASHWANAGEKGREMDYQIWCGPAMGAFNDWVRGSYLEDPANRSVVDIARHIMTGAAYLFRLQQLKAQQVALPPSYSHYRPQPF
jgi:trans-AT polyketide synthase, acyltransferase and oxidoreductase domains